MPKTAYNRAIGIRHGCPATFTQSRTSMYTLLDRTNTVVSTEAVTEKQCIYSFFLTGIPTFNPEPPDL